MSEEQNKEILNQDKDMHEKDLFDFLMDIWNRRKFIIKWGIIGAIIGTVIAFTAPEEFVARGKFAPESNGSMGMSGGIGGLAAMAGINVGGSNSMGEAISTELYPDVIASTPFLSDILFVEVETIDGDIKTSLYEYISTEIAEPWWKHVMNAPFMLINWVTKLFSGSPGTPTNTNTNTNKAINLEALTNKQNGVFNTLKGRIVIERKGNVTELSVEMQDKQVAVDVAKVVLENLQSYVIRYRTQKVMKDLEYTQNMYDEAKVNYFAAQKAYATFEDKNKNITSSRYRTEQERLKNEMTLCYSIYSGLASNLEQTKLKVQEQTPVYTIIEPVSRPLRESNNRRIIIIAYIFLAIVGSASYVLIKDAGIFKYLRK